MCAETAGQEVCVQHGMFDPSEVFASRAAQRKRRVDVMLFTTWEGNSCTSSQMLPPFVSRTVWLEADGRHLM